MPSNLTDLRKGCASIVRVLGWNAGLLIVVLLVVELIFGNWLSEQHLGLLMVPRNVEIEHVLDHVPGKPTVRYTRDEYGLRGQYEKPSDIEVLVVGGSTTNELYVGDSNTFVDIMRQRLDEMGLPMVIVNAGVDGHSTIGHTRAFDVWFSRIPGLAPRWVVFYIGINDVYVADQARYDNTIAESGDTMQKLIRRFKNDSVLYQVFRIVRGALRARDVRVIYGTDASARYFPVSITPTERAAATATSKKPQGLPQFRNRLHALVDKVEDWGAKAIFVTQRRGDVRYDGNVLRGASDAAIRAQIVLDRINAVTLSVCAKTDALCVDLASEIRFQNGDFSDHVHTTRQGSERVGTFLAKKLAPIFRGH